MSSFLTSDQTTGGKEAELAIRDIADPRERSLALFLIGQATFASGIAGYHPASPIDLRYIVEIARCAYRNKKTLEIILSGDLDQVEWPDVS